MLPPLGMLGALDAGSQRQLAALSARIHCAVALVETSPWDSVRDAAAAVVQVSPLALGPALGAAAAGTLVQPTAPNCKCSGR